MGRVVLVGGRRSGMYFWRLWRGIVGIAWDGGLEG